MSCASVYSHTTAEKVHSLGLEDVARIKREMEDIKEKVGSPKEEDLKTFMEKIKADPRFYYATGTPASLFSPSSPPLPSPQPELRPCCPGEEIVQEYKRMLKEAEAKLPQYFGILPKAAYDVRYLCTIR